MIRILPLLLPLLSMVVSTSAEEADTAREALITSIAREKTIIREFRDVSRVDDLAPSDVPSFAESVERFASLAQRSARWRVVDLDFNALVSDWKTDFVRFEPNVRLTLFPDAVLELEMPKSDQPLGNIAGFTANITNTNLDTSNIPPAVTQVAGSLRRWGTLTVHTIFFDGRFYSIYPLLDVPDVHEVGASPHLVVEFDPEVEYTRQVPPPEGVINFEADDIDPRDIKPDWDPNNPHVFGPDN